MSISQRQQKVMGNGLARIDTREKGVGESGRGRGSDEVRYWC